MAVLSNLDILTQTVMLGSVYIYQLGEFGNVVVSLQYVEVPSHNSEKDSVCICSITKIIDCNTTTS